MILHVDSHPRPDHIPRETEANDDRREERKDGSNIADKLHRVKMRIEIRSDGMGERTRAKRKSKEKHAN